MPSFRPTPAAARPVALLSLALLAIGASPAGAQFTAYDGFASPGSYRADGGYADPVAGPSNALLFDAPPADGTNVGQGPAVTGFSGAWASSSAFSSSVYPRVEQSQLTYTDGNGGSLLTSSGQINLFRSVGDGGSGNKSFNRSLSLANSLPVSLYMSVLVRFNAGVSSLGIDWLSNSADGLNPRPFKLEMDAAGALTFSGFSTAGTYTSQQGALTADTTHLLVFKLTDSDLNTSHTTSGDSMRVFIDPVLSTEGSNTPITYGDTNTTFYVSANALWSLRDLKLSANVAGGGSVIFDEVRIGSTWSSVTTTVPEPTTAGLLLLGLAAAGGLRRQRSA